MKWSEVSIHTTAEAVDAVSNLLYEMGANGVVIEDPEVLHRDWDTPFGEIYQLSPDDFPAEGVFVKAYLAADSSTLGDMLSELKQQLDELTGYGLDIGKGTIAVNDVHEDEWAHAWKKYYKPVHVSDRMTIKPVWEEYQQKSPDEVIIEMDPGMAFGTGTHPTTILCLRALEKYLQPGDRVFDVGTGTAILSIAAVKLGAEHVLAMDLDEVAVRSAQANTELNGVDEKITVRQNNLLEGVDGPVDLVVANILAEIIVRFTDDVYRVLKPEGTFIASGIIEAKAQEVKNAMAASGLEIVETIFIDDWVAITAKKR
ncbi:MULTISPECIES: 50S ribosomal protein L11 methyltransferase [Brevibacillus]|jgi:ribosomal protein L11 methyltransferase|uniref:Ribosomal protein L11 methyltransferase n=1 Tax=Brevibacillus borstelensis AK1 TaxID=1300222 RepID=M8DBG6_9BACL|nr:50S ribosomal protein L11 methyltransferase [Brevibacillus borstelensis]EMT50758.1 ribosomal protein L11 methyltransferase [Brevibacillus borstelensis AK1]KKX55926.1 ribosomal protein L11 methyltransferase [Brevibacillus borstelensis cifa_chp40]MBE5396749.1 50S ribosomal protein L11 methyltransferase [Brevibacillus borstelensis]MCC0564487.1 50S ribosomal protein L11 methyltransferase [Brevibacillus borstelensis]MCM3471159.1 50S ribosomal protein L11 methyltransferase [Brevibacillus borstele